MYNFSQTIIILFYYIFCATTLLTYTGTTVDGAILNELEKSLPSSPTLVTDLTESSLTTSNNQLEPEQRIMEATTRWTSPSLSPRTLFVAELSALKAVALLTFPLLIPVLFAAAAVLVLPLQLFSLSSPLNVIGKRIHQQQQPHHDLLGSNIFRTRPVIRKVPTTRQPNGLYAGLS